MVAYLGKDVDLDSLQPRRDFSLLLMNVAFPADPSQVDEDSQGRGGCVAAEVGKC